MKAAKEKILFMLVIASALLVCAPAIASSTHHSTLENRAEIFLQSAQNRVERQAFESANRVENYDSLGGVALESSVAPNSVATGGWHKATGGKWISLDDAGGAIRPLSNDKIKFTDLGIDYLEDHLSRFKSPSGGMWDHNAAMINDLRKIARGELEATQIHRNFYSHELREMTRLRRLGSTSGPVDPFDYANTHYATLFEYGIPWGDHGSYLYTRFARTFFPGGF
ncbi:hypothetical protein [Allorhodopirellula solitaria]|uniref:Uncharacterized protein n=1 Tax=Allorhodopirellula solitaria TaxID=2527987 RepID=A0A5C5X003_9BACT|nr:hypothetical protein [Allorhodopirellula solitaria]TWT55522.1 hypothetical protein CA85_48750 [Allorhodopirellula solitaria]